METMDLFPVPEPAGEIFKILLVDDRPESLASLEGVLEDPQYELVTARTGLEALQCLVKDDFAAILLDVKMPDIDGFDTARLIKQRPESRHIPIIFLTAKDEARHFSAEGYSAGAVDYLDKLIDPLVLKAKLSAFVELFRKSRRMEDSLKRVRQSRHYEDVLRSSRGARLILDLEGKLSRASRGFYDLSRLAPADVEGRSLYEFDDGRWDIPRLRTLVGAALSRGESFQGFEVQGDFFGDSLRTLRLSGRRIVREEGEIAVTLLEIEDMTQRSQAKELEAFRRRESVQRDFIANISHEFRTPVTAIKGFAETLRRGGMDDKRNRLRFVKTIEKHSDSLGCLIEDLLTVSAQESGTRSPKPKKIPLASFARAFIRGMAPVVKQKKQTLRARVDPGLKVWADPQDLERILGSLCENAFKFSDLKTAIEISGAAREGRAIISVCDKGQGIPPEALSRIFERFSQAGKPSPRKSRGIGLGLSIAKGAVEINKGKIWAENNAEGGATFHFTLPLA